MENPFFQIIEFLVGIVVLYLLIRKEIRKNRKEEKEKFDNLATGLRDEIHEVNDKIIINTIEVQSMDFALEKSLQNGYAQDRARKRKELFEKAQFKSRNNVF